MWWLSLGEVVAQCSDLVSYFRGYGGSIFRDVVAQLQDL
jgi:hypothetical protein